MLMVPKALQSIIPKCLRYHAPLRQDRGTPQITAQVHKMPETPQKKQGGHRMLGTVQARARQTRSYFRLELPQISQQQERSDMAAKAPDILRCATRTRKGTNRSESSAPLNIKGCRLSCLTY